MLTKKIAFITLLCITFLGCSKPEETTQAEINKLQPDANEPTEISKSIVESAPISKTVDTEWKDPKTGLTWLKCSIGQDLVNGVCIKENITENSILKKIQNNIQGDLDTGNDRSYLFTYSQAEQAISYLNSQNYKGKNNWRLPTIFEISTLRTCINSSDYLDDMVKVYDGNKLIDLSYKCENESDNVLNSIIPVDTHIAGWYNQNIWTSTLAVEESSSGTAVPRMWAISLTKGIIENKNANGPESFVLVRD